MSKDAAQFVFMTCRAGAEGAVKGEVARAMPEWRLSFSRPGFLTFKVAGDSAPDDRQLAERHWTFAHAHGISLGRVTGEKLEQLAAAVWNHDALKSLLEDGGFAAIHVWEPVVAAEDGEIASLVTPLCDEIEMALAAAESCAKPSFDAAQDRPFDAAQGRPFDAAQDRQAAAGAAKRPARRNARVLDVVVLAPGEWWIGCHRAVRRHERWPGGAIPVAVPEHAVSRAYAKMEEALAWSDLPLAADDECVEIGCAPGGASQALLERGLFVTGIDPADVDLAVVTHPRFRHLKKRGKDVRRKEFEGVRWLAADMNIAPEATLDEVEAIVTHPGLAIRGMVLTLKFSDWKAAARVPEFVERVRSWGYRDVRTRQLTTGGQEICLVALRRKALRRVGVKRTSARKPQGRRKARVEKAHSAPPKPHF
jgi:23S rRNA (cytidine2498-2'-O)-methyltransferase